MRPTTLAGLKARKFTAIDSKTDYLISLGFSYSSKQFSLSAEAQSRLNGVFQLRDDPSMVYPVTWNTKDDNDYVELADSAAVRDFYLAAVAAYRGPIDSGTALKEQVRVASTVAEVNAIYDPR